MKPLAAALFAAVCGGALAAEVEGEYAFGDATVRVAKGGKEGAFVGTLERAEGERLRALLGRPVLDLARAADGRLSGRLNACHVRLSDDPTAWLDVAKAEVLPSGDLRCTVRQPSGASAEILYKRVQPEAAAPVQGGQGGEPGELAGAWRDPDGTVTHFVSHRDRYVGQLDKVSSLLASQGFRPGEERVRVKRTAPGVYRGTMRLRGGKRERWEEVEITVEGARLEIALLRDGEPTDRRLAAERLGTGGGTATAEAPDAVDDGDIAGTWRDSYGGVNRFERKGDSDYEGVIVRLSQRNEGYGFKLGEVGIRAKRTGRHTYEGKVLARTFGGRNEWWEPIDIAVHQSTLKYTRRMRSGGEEQGAATRTQKEGQP